MNNIALRVSIAFMMALSALSVGVAQQPRLSNGQLTIRSAAAGLENEFRSIAGSQNVPGWIGYAVPMIAGDQSMCCGDHSSGFGCCGTCRLEGREAGSTHSGD